MRSSPRIYPDGDNICLILVDSHQETLLATPVLTWSSSDWESEVRKKALSSCHPLGTLQP